MNAVDRAVSGWLDGWGRVRGMRVGVNGGLWMGGYNWVAGGELV